MIRTSLATATSLLLAAGTAAAQGPAAQGQLGTPNYDVVLEVPELSVDSIGLNVEQLRAHVALDANAMNLVALNAGVDVGIDRVQLDITGVVAEAYLYADLDNVTRIVARVVQTLNNNPELLTRLLTVVDTTVSTVGGVANTVLVKPNQAGTLSGAWAVVRRAREAGYGVVVSARSGESEDAWLADLAVGWRARQIKVGSLARSERTAKWNRLLRIEAELGAEGGFFGAGP